MINADIITEMTSSCNPSALASGVKGIRDAYRAIPDQLKQEMLSEFSNLEYTMLQAMRNLDATLKPWTSPDHLQGDTILDLYQASK